MADPHLQLSEEEFDEPIPQSKLQELSEETRIVSSAFRHVEHQQAVEQVAGVAAAAAIQEERALSINESKSPSSPWMASIAQRTPSIPLSAVSLEESDSISGGVQLRMSGGPGSTEAGDLTRTDTVSELLGLSPSLDSALRLNMALQRRFRERIMKLESTLLKNVERQAKLKKEITSARILREEHNKRDGKLNIRITHFCVPYFRNRGGMPAPMNDDAKEKVDRGYIDLYITRPRTWLTVEKEALDETVRKEWREQEIKSFQMTTRELERRVEKLDAVEKITELENKIKELKTKTRVLEKLSYKRVVPNRGEERLDWHIIAAKAFDGYRTPDECRLQWENLLHPDVNSRPFTENEDLVIQKAVNHSKTRIPDWESIAAKLNTHRTAYQVMQRYVSFIEPALKPKFWTKKDSDKLLQTVNMLRIGSHIPWAQVHQHFIGFSRAQLQSRWRVIDPEISKGPFTVEEDFILIKGLHMFGLNFDNITHFMPGRTMPQVRERFKRTIHPSLARRPWTKEQDDILIRECKVGSKNWRKMIMELPKYNACEIRARYHTLQVWQTISGTNLIPPPLFPLTCTVNPEVVQEIRKAMLSESLDVKHLVDESRKEIKLKNVVKELEERRLIIKERMSQNNLERMKRVTEKRGRQRGTPNPHHVPLHTLMLTEYFIPQRPIVSYPSLSFNNVQKNLQIICNALQLKLSLPERKGDEMKQFPTLSMTKEDWIVVNALSGTHTTGLDGFCFRDCRECMPSFPEKVPFMPPCKTTLGIFKSLLVHRPKLNEMATREFLLYKCTREELLNMESLCRGKRFPRKKALQMDPLAPEEANAIPQPQVDPTSETEASQDESESEAPGPSTKKPTKIHITLQDVNKGSKKNVRGLKVSGMGSTSGEIRGYSRVGRVSNVNTGDITNRDIKKEVSRIFMPTEGGTSTAPADNSNPVIKLEVNGQVINIDDGEVIEGLPPPGFEDESKREASDNLLFQRMLSLFYWPAMMTLAMPPESLVSEINHKIKSGQLEKPTKRKTTSTYHKDNLNIKQQFAYISHLTEKQEKELEALKKDKTQKLQNPTEENYALKKDPYSPGIEEVEQQTSSDVVIDEEQEESGKGNISSSRCRKGISVRRRKENLKSLRRSLVMKVIWDARRKGCYPQRTSDRDKRRYNPRGSRTRDCVRKDLIKPPEPLKPWNFPLDGPMRVQPQVPQIPSEEMLAVAFAENPQEEELPQDQQTSADPTTSEMQSTKRKGRGKKSHKIAESDSEEMLPESKRPASKEPEERERFESQADAEPMKPPDSKLGIDRSRLQRKSKLMHSQVRVMRTAAEGHTSSSEEAGFDSPAKLEMPSKIIDSVSSTSGDESVGDSGNQSAVLPRPEDQMVLAGGETPTTPQGSIKKYTRTPRKRSLGGPVKSVVANVSNTETPEGIDLDELTPAKRAKTLLAKEPYQVSFHSLLEDEFQEDSVQAQLDHISISDLSTHSVQDAKHLGIRSQMESFSESQPSTSGSKVIRHTEGKKNYTNKRKGKK